MIDSRNGLIYRSVRLQILASNGEEFDIPTNLKYDAQDPYAVSAEFSASNGRIVWTFGRDLLIEGLLEPIGDGDVHVWPSTNHGAGPVLMIELSSPDGEALLQAHQGDVFSFVVSMKELVPQGTESEFLDIDAAIARCFG
jgi:hypothetical protein